MFDELNKYSSSGHFFLSKDQSLSQVCNAPRNQSGIYIVYALEKGQVKLIYVGSSGKILNDGKIKHRNGGLYDRIVNGKQFEKPRRISWIEKMFEQDIEALDVYWYVTYTNQIKDIPAFVEALLVQRFFDIHGCLPRWNKEF